MTATHATDLHSEYCIFAGCAACAACSSLRCEDAEYAAICVDFRCAIQRNIWRSIPSNFRKHFRGDIYRKFRLALRPNGAFIICGVGLRNFAAQRHGKRRPVSANDRREKREIRKIRSDCANASGDNARRNAIVHAVCSIDARRPAAPTHCRDVVVESSQCRRSSIVGTCPDYIRGFKELFHAASCNNTVRRSAGAASRLCGVSVLGYCAAVANDKQRNAGRQTGKQFQPQ